MNYLAVYTSSGGPVNMSQWGLSGKIDCGLSKSLINNLHKSASIIITASNQIAVDFWQCRAQSMEVKLYMSFG